MKIFAILISLLFNPFSEEQRTPHISNFDVCTSNMTNSNGECVKDQSFFDFGVTEMYGKVDLFNAKSGLSVYLKIIDKSKDNIIVTNYLTLKSRDITSDQMPLTFLLKTPNGKPLAPGSYQYSVKLPSIKTL